MRFDLTRQHVRAGRLVIAEGRNAAGCPLIDPCSLTLTTTYDPPAPGAPGLEVRCRHCDRYHLPDHLDVASVSELFAGYALRLSRHHLAGGQHRTLVIAWADARVPDPLFTTGRRVWRRRPWAPGSPLTAEIAQGWNL